MQCNEAEGIFKTHIIAKNKQTLDEALELIHLAATKLIYKKLAQAMEQDACLEVGDIVLARALGWE